MRLTHKMLLRLFPVLAMCIPSLLIADAIVTAGSDDVAVGDTFGVPVIVSGVSDLYGFQFDLSYNPAVLQLTNITEGSFLSSAGTTFFIAGAIDNTAGTATSTADSLIGAIPGASGEGDLAIFDFKAISLGNSDLALSNVTLLDSSLNSIPFVTSNGQVVVVVSSVPEPSFLPVLVVVLACLFLARSKFTKRYN